MSAASAIHHCPRSGRLDSAAHPTMMPAQLRIRRRPARKKLVAATSAIGQPAVASRSTRSWTTSDSICAPATTAAPMAVNARLLTRRARAGPPSGRVGRSSSIAKSTPPMATAWPHRASPRSSTSTNPATATQARRRATTQSMRRKKIGVPIEARIKNQWAFPKADSTITR